MLFVPQSVPYIKIGIKKADGIIVDALFFKFLLISKYRTQVGKFLS